MSDKRRVMMALDRLVELPQEVLDDIALVVRNAAIQSDYTGMDSDGGSFLQVSVSGTLSYLADNFEDLKTLNDKSSVLEY